MSPLKILGKLWTFSFASKEMFYHFKLNLFKNITKKNQNKIIINSNFQSISAFKSRILKEYLAQQQVIVCLRKHKKQVNQNLLVNKSLGNQFCIPKPHKILSQKYLVPF